MDRECSQFIDTWRNFLSDRDFATQKFFCNPSIVELVDFYLKSKELSTKESKYNIFEIISDLYYREKFHSDLIAHFLDPNGKHEMWNKPLFSFIDLINVCSRFGIAHANYSYAKIEKEHPTGDGFIDILIYDDISQHAIIIENKLNNAVDMPRQIPRYCQHVEAIGYNIDAVVYLPIDIYSKPDTTTWREEDHKWDSLICIIPGYDNTNKLNLATGWITRLADMNVGEHNRSNLLQYASLIKKLSNQNMDKVSLEKFFQTVLQGNNLDVANSIASMMGELPTYLATKICDTYKIKCSPFERVWIYKDKDAVFEKWIFKGVYIKIDVWCDTNNYNLLVWTPEYENGKSFPGYKDIKDFFRSNGIECFNDYEIENDFRMWKHIPISVSFPEIIDPILDALKKA